MDNVRTLLAEWLELKRENARWHEGKPLPDTTRVSELDRALRALDPDALRVAEERERLLREKCEALAREWKRRSMPNNHPTGIAAYESERRDATGWCADELADVLDMSAESLAQP